ncbi:YDG domain-containing protein [Leptothrix ochracea]|uniref:two-partner secretion domain-containing protein n=1 Tax=Leptothrix ochracea TaxID=735331 RepID=UPI0034E2F9DC
MNHSYRLVWNEEVQRHVPAPECARGRGKGGRKGRQAVVSLGLGVGLLGLSMGSLALAPNALPTGGVVQPGGTAVIANPTPTSLTITQSTTRAVINWGTYDVGSSSVVSYAQPAGGVTLNRVVGSTPSQIMGQINANGQVYLINPNGVLVGQGASVNLHGFLASTLETVDSDFMAGTLKFAGPSTAAVRNDGHITTDTGGTVALIGNQVVNSGQITAPQGNVVLAAGSDVVLNVGANGLLKAVINTGALQASVTNAGQIQADDGHVQLSAAAATNALISAVVNNTGSVLAQGIALKGGVIELTGDVVSQAGTLDASGIQGGQVQMAGRSVLQSGAIHADGSGGPGGQVGLHATQTLLQTQSGLITANATGAGMAGGQVVLDGGSTASSSAFLSGQAQTKGDVGGQVVVSATTLTLAGAALNADGVTTGGTVLVGGDAPTGSATAGWTATAPGTLAKATDVSVNASSTLSALGAGGKIVVSADGLGTYDGSAVTGPNGHIDLYSNKAPQLLQTTPPPAVLVTQPFAMRGSANAGTGGVVRVSSNDPIIIDATPAKQSYTPLVDPNPATGDMHGSGGVVEVGGGNILVASPNDNFGGPGAGAAYLYSGSTGSLISAVYGARAGDHVSSGGVTKLSNGNAVISSPAWSNLAQAEAGAVTWVSASAGVNGSVSATNSLVGGAALDAVGSGGVTALSNGHYVVASPMWGSQMGAVTWGDGLAGSTGVVSGANSLTGSVFGDRVGSGGIKALQGPSGNYVVSSPNWGGALGAATWRSGLGQGAAAVDATNSLVGSTVGDMVSSGGITALSNGNYVVSSPAWSNGSATSAGAVTWGSGASGVAGAVSAANSLVGTAAFDQVGSQGVTALSNGNYVVDSPMWAGLGSTKTQVGAVTWADGGVGLAGTVSRTNSLVGSLDNDQVGSGGVTALSNGNYVVASPMWDGPLPTTPALMANVGAVTWGTGATGVSGAVSAANSMVGSTANDRVGSGGVTALNNGNYVVASPFWSSTTVPELGAVTWANGAAAAPSSVSTANSVVGRTALDQVGSGGVTALSNGNYVISSPLWDGAAPNVGAVTWASGTASTASVVAATNSLTGSVVNDQVGSGGVTALSAGNYVVSSPLWNSSAAPMVGAITVATNGTGPGVGLVTSGATGNSLVGSTTNDLSGSSIKALSNGDFVLSSPNWSANGMTQVGAVWLASTQPAQAMLLPKLAPAGTALQVSTPKSITNNVQATLAGTLLMEAGQSLTLNQGLSSTAATSSIAPVAMTLVTHTNFSNQVAGTASALTAPNSTWQLWSVDPRSDVRGNLAYDYKQYNAVYGTTTPLGTGNGVLYVLAPLITPTLGGAAQKVYDTTNTVLTPNGLTLTAGPVAPTAAPTVPATPATPSMVGVGVVDGDVVNLGLTLATYASPNVGTAIPVTVTGVTVARAINGVGAAAKPVYGYQVDPASVSGGTITAHVGVITPAPLTVTGTTVASKVYDATTTATITTAGTLQGVFPADAAAVALVTPQTAVFANKNSGVAKTVNITNVINGAGAANYAVQPSTTTADITPKALTVTGTSAAQDKFFNGNTVAPVASTATLVGVIGTDQVSLVQSGTFVDPLVGTGKNATIARALGGTDALNYTFADTVASNANILALASGAVPVAQAVPAIKADAAAARFGHPKMLVSRSAAEDQVMAAPTYKAEPAVAPVCAPAPKVEVPACAPEVKPVAKDPLPNKEVAKEPPPIVISGDVLFDVDQSVIRPEAKQGLADLVPRMTGQQKINIAGHTDSTASHAHNVRLSERRANAVREYLVLKGVARDRISTVGRAETVPVAPNTTAEGRMKNRRVEIRIQ